MGCLDRFDFGLKTERASLREQDRPRLRRMEGAYVMATILTYRPKPVPPPFVIVCPHCLKEIAGKKDGLAVRNLCKHIVAIHQPKGAA